MKELKEIYEICQPILESGKYDSAIMHISQIAHKGIEREKERQRQDADSVKRIRQKHGIKQ